MTSGHHGYGQAEPEYPIDGPPQPPVETNAKATWSIVLAFLFAPAGAVFGHLALAELGRRDQRGRNRAVIGLALSYTVLAVAVGALVVVGRAACCPVGDDGRQLPDDAADAVGPAAPGDDDRAADADRQRRGPAPGCCSASTRSGPS